MKQSIERKQRKGRNIFFVNFQINRIPKSWLILTCATTDGPPPEIGLSLSFPLSLSLSHTHTHTFANAIQFLTTFHPPTGFFSITMFVFVQFSAKCDEKDFSLSSSLSLYYLSLTYIDGLP
jgi:hypothetical protein